MFDHVADWELQLLPHIASQNSVGLHITSQVKSKILNSKVYFPLNVPHCCSIIKLKILNQTIISWGPSVFKTISDMFPFLVTQLFFAIMPLGKWRLKQIQKCERQFVGKILTSNNNNKAFPPHGSTGVEVEGQDFRHQCPRTSAYTHPKRKVPQSPGCYQVYSCFFRSILLSSSHCSLAHMCTH